MIAEAATTVDPMKDVRARARVMSIDLLLLAGAIGSMCAALCIGPIPISLPVVLAALAAPLTHHAVDPVIHTIVWLIRFPRVVLECLVGASLAVAGLGFQALLRNDLAEPYTTGVSAGASVGAGVVIVAGATAVLGGLLQPLAAFGGAIGVLVFVYASARRSGRLDVRSMLLLGVVANAFLYAVQMLLLQLAGKNSDEILGWLMGSLAAASWRDCGLLVGFSVVGMLLIASQAYAMNLFAAGETTAQQLGLDVERFKKTIMLAASLLAAAAVSVCGIVAFVGLVVPHIARRLAGTPDHRAVLPTTALCGAVMMIWSDTIARVVLGGDIIPVGVVTAFWGAPFFWWLLRRRPS
jgi:iron complex transport system permease protein